MIEKRNYGKHQDVLFFEFGTGDILMTKGIFQDDTKAIQLIFSQDIPHKVGEETDVNKGKSFDEMPAVKAVMQFNNPESIAAVIHSLVELQKQLFEIK